MSSDIQTEKFIFRISAARFHPYIKLARLDRPIGTWLLLFPGWWSIILAGGGFAYMSAHDWRLMVLFAVGALLMRGAGCVVNDLWDRELDAKVERTRTRPLPSGEVTVRQALVFLALLLVPSFGILMTLNRLSIILGFLSLALVATYPLMKRVTWWPQLFLGFTFNWGALLGWAAVRGHLDAPAFYLYAGGIFWTLAYDTIYAHQDKEDDALIGVKSTARLWGDNSGWFAGVCFAAAVVLFGVCKFFAIGTQNEATPLWVALVTAQVIWQLMNWDMKSPESCLKIFRSNQVFGWLVTQLMGF